MSNEFIDCVQQLVRDLEIEVGSLEDVMPSFFNLDPSCSARDVVNLNEKCYAAAVSAASQCSSSGKIYLEEQKSKLMVDTLMEVLNGHERLNSLNKPQDISWLRKFVTLNESVTDIEPINQDLQLLKSTQRQTKEHLDEILRSLFPDLREEIKEVLSRVEEEKQYNFNNEVPRPWSPRLCPALELLSRATIIEQMEPNVYKFNSEM